MVRRLAFLSLALLAACRQPTVGEVGGQEIRDAHPLATWKASERASAASPAVVPEAAKGRPLQQPPAL